MWKDKEILYAYFINRDNPLNFENNARETERSLGTLTTELCRIIKAKRRRV